MKNRNIIFALLALCIAGTSCVKEKLETTYNAQEDKIDQYISKNIVSGEDSLRVVYNEGTSRLIRIEGNGEELSETGSVSFYYAGYTFNSGFSPNNLFITNHQQTAQSSGWELTDDKYELYEINMSDAKLIDGLRKGLLGVKSGEECEILFSGKYAFGNDDFGIIPANSALLYRIWVVAVSNE